MKAETAVKTHILTDRDLIKVLLVEDDVCDRRLVERLLAKRSQRVECLGNSKYDIVLLDLRLPDSSGIDTVRKVSEVNLHLPIVVLTGLDDEEMGILAIKSGATDYLVKGQPLENLLVRMILYVLQHDKEKKLILDTNHRLQETSQKLFIANRKFEKKSETLQEACAKLEFQLEEWTVQLSEINKCLNEETSQRKIVEQNLWPERQIFTKLY